MQHEVHHGLGIELAKRAVRAAWASYEQRFAKYSPKATWTSDTRATVSFAAAGATLDGTLEVRERDVVIDLDVPFLLRPFRKRAIEVIEREIEHWVAKARAGELG
jgi:hypothetical protein